MTLDLIRRFDDGDWHAGSAAAPTRAVEPVLEAGCVLWFPNLAFTLPDDERRLLDARFADPKAKNISLRGDRAELRGAAGTAAEQQALRTMLVRYRDQACALVDRLFPHYRGHLTRANTSFRPVAIEGRATSWRKDDTRLHVDAFPSNPSRGLRLLRVFHNANPDGLPREWRVGEPFEAFAARHVGHIPRPLPGSAWLLDTLHITKRRRSEYDHLMLQLHDRAKADGEWQRNAPQQRIDFAPGSTWVCFSDQVLHAAMRGQHMIEQTLTLHTDHLLDPATSPLRVLERLTGRTLAGGPA
ncbi:MAG TPA: Kdo hydroxylase family protein [Rubrivivax sp.]|nr:Kdo hydroxylase family protein [Rubrivivax sp.]